MFVVRSAQVESLRNAVREPLHRRILAFLRETMPEKLAGLSEAQILGRIIDADKRATARGIVTERGVTLFTALTFQLNPTFDEIPQVRAVFELPSPDPDTKIRWYFKSLALYARDREKQGGGVGARIAATGTRVLSLIVAATLAPFVMGMVGAFPSAAAAAPALAAVGEAAVALGGAVLGFLSSPVVLTVLAIAVVATIVTVGVSQMQKADQKADDVSDEKTDDETPNCPQDEAGQSVKPQKKPYVRNPEREAVDREAKEAEKRLSRGKPPLTKEEADRLIENANKNDIPVRAKPNDLAGDHWEGPHIHVNERHVPVEPGYQPPAGATVNTGEGD
jgi:hypothetical protein